MDGWVVPEKGGNAFREPDVVERLKVDLMGIGLRTHGWRGVLGVSVGGLLVMVVVLGVLVLVLGVLVVVLGVTGCPWVLVRVPPGIDGHFQSVDGY